jgi:hypothetical protein
MMHDTALARILETLSLIRFDLGQEKTHSFRQFPDFEPADRAGQPADRSVSPGIPHYS